MPILCEEVGENKGIIDGGDERGGIEEAQDGGGGGIAGGEGGRDMDRAGEEGNGPGDGHEVPVGVVGASGGEGLDGEDEELVAEMLEDFLEAWDNEDFEAFLETWGAENLERGGELGGELEEA